MKYWELNENREIVALVDFWNVRAGDIGAKIPEGCQLGSNDYPLWIAKDVTIGDDDVTINNNVNISNDVTISNYVIIGYNVKIGHNVTIANCVNIGNDVNLGNYVDISEGVKIGNNVNIGKWVKIGHNVKIGNCVKISNDVNIGYGVKVGNNVKIGYDVNIAENAMIETKKFIQFVGFGLNNRTILIYKIKGKKDPVVSVGCQCGISFAEFKERVNNAAGTSKESANVYKQYWTVFQNAFDCLN